MNRTTAFLSTIYSRIRYITNVEFRYVTDILNKNDTALPQQIAEVQNIAFKNLINHVFLNIPYYKKKYAEHGIGITDIKSIEDINKLPLLTKDDIKSNYPTILWDKLPDHTCPYGTSGGTTGEPIKVYLDWRCYHMEKEAYYRGIRWMGWKPGYGMVRLFGGSLGGRKKNLQFYLRKKITGELFLPAFELTPSNARAYLDEIKNMGETFIQGYCSSIYDLALYIKKYNYKGLKIKGIFPTAEQLAVEQADVMREVYRAPVKSFYGCGEINSLGFQQDEKGPYLVPDEINYIENYPNDITPYNLLLTSLYNYKMPMIRYLNGDAGILLKPGQTNFNRTVISELQGRTSDMFIRPDGSYISSIVATQTMQISGLTHKIRKYQLIQTGPVSVNIIYTPFSEKLTYDEEQHIAAIYKKRIGNEFSISVKESDAFIVSSSGKHRLMIREYII